MEQNRPEPGSWDPVNVSDLKLCDEIWFKGDWRTVTATGRGHYEQICYFEDGGNVSFDISITVMRKKES